jgi:hypothetical protein
MLKCLILGSAIFTLFSLPALAADWRTTGVSTRTRETVAIDMDSINRISRYDVRFRYLIGKDLVEASVNCDSSLVTPDQGNPFVPDMTGATREMIKLACGSSRDSSLNEVERGRYLVPSSKINPSQRGLEFYGFWVSDEAIYATRHVLGITKATSNLSYDSAQIAEHIAQYCAIRSKGISDEAITRSIVKEISESSRYRQSQVILYASATRASARV